jgi:hypothetical protein
MITPSHIVLSLVVLGKQSEWQRPWPLIIGAVLPDAMMFVFYFIEKFVLGVPEETIWRVDYFKSFWQMTFDVFNSIPLILLLLFISIRKKWSALSLISGSMLLHVLMDFPLHREDAHHHLWPFSDYQFISPVSYWDPEHYGTVFGFFELLLLIGLSIYCFRRYESKWVRLFVVLFIIVAVGMLVYWRGVFG